MLEEIQGNDFDSDEGICMSSKRFGRLYTFHSCTMLPSRLSAWA